MKYTVYVQLHDGLIHNYTLVIYIYIYGLIHNYTLAAAIYIYTYIAAANGIIMNQSIM